MTDHHPNRPVAWDPGPLRPSAPGLPAYPQPAYGQPPYGQMPYGYAPPPVFPPAPPGLSPGPDDPLVSVNFNGWWTRSFRLLRAIWRPAAVLQLLWALPLLATAAVVSVPLADAYTDVLELSDTVIEPDWGSLVWAIPLGLLTALLSALALLATLQLVVQAALGGPRSAAGALRAAGARLPAYVGWGFLGGLLTLVGFLFCIVPGYYVTAVIAVLPVVVLLERGAALTRCFRLFHARPGDALARIGTMVGLAAAVSVAGQALFGIVFVLDLQLSENGVSAIGFFASMVVTVLIGVITQVGLAPMTVTTYADLRARHEPFTTASLTR